MRKLLDGALDVAFMFEPPQMAELDTEAGEWALCHDDRDGWNLLLAGIGVDPRDPSADRIYDALIASVEIEGQE